ncbi:MAG: GLUG motif-containing protein [archaeon]|mgnify:CR=1 FL=1
MAASDFRSPSRSCSSAQGARGAQGTIEYLVIIAVVVVIGLVVVSLVTTTFNSPAQQLSSVSAGIGSSTGPISISESVLDIEGDGLITLGNNSGQNLSVTSISIGGEDVVYDSTYLPVGTGTTFSLQNAAGNCSCVGAVGTTKTCEVIVSAMSEYGVVKIYTSTVTIECVQGAQPSNLSAVVQPLQAACGDSNGVTFTAPPLSGICLVGSDSGVLIGQSFYDWNCSVGTSFISCRANRQNGVGSLADPKIINTPQEIQDMNLGLNLNYVLGMDINMYSATRAGGELWNGGAGFKPIGGLGNPFSGSFDGNNNTISGLRINMPSSYYVGLFGASAGNISNLGLIDVNVTGRDYVGGLVGEQTGGTISGFYSTGNVYGTKSPDGMDGYRVGGFVGRQNGGSISGSHSAVNVYGQSGVYEVGGLVGRQESGSISNSYSTGSVSGYYSIGGLVGNAFGSISNSYATGGVSGWSYMGGLVGKQDGGTISSSYATGNITGQWDLGGFVGTQNGGSISNSYSTGSVSGYYNMGGFVGSNFGAVSNSYSTGEVLPRAGSFNFGGFVGQIYQAVPDAPPITPGTITNSFWDKNTSGQQTSPRATGKTTAEMKTISTYSGASWNIDSNSTSMNNGYPFLGWQIGNSAHTWFIN